MRLQLIYIFVLLCIIKNSFGVDPNNFKTCEQSSFCRRCRKMEPGKSKFALKPGSLNTYQGSITAEVINKATQHEFVLKLTGLHDNTFRVTMDEKSPLRPRYRVEHALKEEPLVSDALRVESEDKNALILTSMDNKIVITPDPLRLDFYKGSKLTVSLNAKGLLNFEHLRKKPEPANTNEENGGGEGGETGNAEKQQAVESHMPDNDPGAWEENFKSHHDSKPYGPEAIALDFSFPVADVLFGIPEHADSFILKSTTGTDPYRLYNLDVFEYVVDSKMALYGSVPVLYAHGSDNTVGVFWHNAAETWVDIYTAEKNVVSSIMNFVSGSDDRDPPAAHFMSESGIIDAFIMLGPSPLDAFKQYTKLTGTTPLPQLYTLAYHQCRWNYKDENDVKTVSTKFDEVDIPMDIMWLDIEYTDGKKYFTWDQFKFSDPLGMIKNLTDVGRHLVVIIDPHIKRDNNYFFHNDCTDRGLYVKTREGKDYEGWCWPGASSYPDFFNKAARDYLAEQYALDKFNTVTADVMIWNDMNEPSVFNGPEVTMLKDLVHFGNWEHRDVHNIYGHMYLMGTFDGLLKRDPTQRPFILTRAHFAGSQRFAAIWTGDNTADWQHLQHTIKMCLSEAVAGFSFCGSDIGGFFGNPDAELFERWYQLGAFIPFFRSHAHIDTKRREPWLYPKQTQDIIRAAIRKRYSYLPLWYTAFFEHEAAGTPVIRPLLAHYPMDKNSYNIDNAYLIQDRLLVRPVMEEKVSKVDVYFPAVDNSGKTGDLWYDVDTFQRYDKPGHQSVPVNEFKIPVFQRGGTIIPKKERIRRAATLMKNDPYTLIVCLDSAGKAKGTLYLDDERSYDYVQNKYIYVSYAFERNELINAFMGVPKYKTKAWIERIVIAGLKAKPTSATLTVDGVAETLDVLPHGNAIAIRKPGVNMEVDFAIKLNY